MITRIFGYSFIPYFWGQLQMYCPARKNETMHWFQIHTLCTTHVKLSNNLTQTRTVLSQHCVFGLPPKISQTRHKTRKQLH